MTTFKAEESEAELCRLLGRVEAGEEEVVTRGGKPVARLVPVERPKPQRRPGTWAGAIRMSDDFDDELGVAGGGSPPGGGAEGIGG